MVRTLRRAESILQWLVKFSVPPAPMRPSQHDELDARKSSFFSTVDACLQLGLSSC